MKQYTTHAIVLKRIKYEEADRIITLLTSDHGKVTVLAKGARKLKSKLAGGIEPLSINEVTIIEGRGEVHRLRSARMQRHFPDIQKDLIRTQAASLMTQSVSKLTEQHAEPVYFQLLEIALSALNNEQIVSDITTVWFGLNLLKIQGSAPDLKNDVSGSLLRSDRQYTFVAHEGGFQVSKYGEMGEPHIKFARLALTMQPHNLAHIKDADVIAEPLAKVLMQGL